MKLYLEECIDWRLTRDIVGHDTRTARDMGWTGLKNGELLARAQAEFDVFITVDRNLAFQQNIAATTLALVVLRARSNRLDSLRLMLDRLHAALPSARAGRVTFVD